MAPVVPTTSAQLISSLDTTSIYYINNHPLIYGPLVYPLHNQQTRTDTYFCWGMAVTYGRYKSITISLPKRLSNGRFTSEAAVRRFQKLNRHLDPEVV
jgi:hypothetical protein